MGTSIYSFIEYDKNEYEHMYYPEQIELLPFEGEIYSLSKEEGLFAGYKEYAFFSAIAGVRNQTEIKPLIPPRGLPQKMSVHVEIAVKNGFFDGLFSIGWLTLSEIKAALEHMKITKDMLGFEILNILEIMENMEEKLGKNRVRFIFGFS